jgi:HlyD family secretion protein
MSLSPRTQKSLTLVAVAAALVLAGGYAWKQWQASHADAGLASGNGRIEATEIDVATKLGGRVEEILVTEGAFVKAGQPLARMQIQTLQAQRAEAVAGKDRAVHTVAAAKAQVALRESDHAAALAMVASAKPSWTRPAPPGALRDPGQGRRQRRAGAGRRPRPRARRRSRAQGRPGPGRRRQGRHRGGPAQVTGAARREAAAATVQRIEAELDDSELTAPRDAACSTAWPSPARCWAPAARC